MLKKNLKHGRGGRHAPGQWEGGEGHTSYDSLPKGACRIMQNYAKDYAKLFSTPRRPSAKGGGFWRLRLMPPTPISTTPSGMGVETIVLLHV